MSKPRYKRLLKQIKREEELHGHTRTLAKLKREYDLEILHKQRKKEIQKEEAEREAKARARFWFSPGIYEGGATGLVQQKK